MSASRPRAEMHDDRDARPLAEPARSRRRRPRRAGRGPAGSPRGCGWSASATASAAGARLDDLVDRARGRATRAGTAASAARPRPPAPGVRARSSCARRTLARQASLLRNAALRRRHRASQTAGDRQRGQAGQPPGQRDGAQARCRRSPAARPGTRAAGWPPPGGERTDRETPCARSSANCVCRRRAQLAAVGIRSVATVPTTRTSSIMGCLVPRACSSRDQNAVALPSRRRQRHDGAARRSGCGRSRRRADGRPGSALGGSLRLRALQIQLDGHARSSARPAAAGGAGSPARSGCEGAGSRSCPP